MLTLVNYYASRIVYLLELHIQPTQWYNLLRDILNNSSLDNISR
jgi:hypothetical protein